jgi:hypothetical protein
MIYISNRTNCYVYIYKSIKEYRNIIIIMNDYEFELNFCLLKITKLQNYIHLDNHCNRSVQCLNCYCSYL